MHVVNFNTTGCKVSNYRYERNTFLECKSRTHLLLMELCCSFKSIVGGNCGFDSRDRCRKVQVVPLTSCAKDIENHLASFSFSGPQTEVELILCRAGIFQAPDSVVSMTICPLHRGKLGIGWTRGSSRCRVPAVLSNHGKNVKQNWPKGDRGLSKESSQAILKHTGVFLQAGTGELLTVQKLSIV